MILYFSATGNSRFTARRLAARMPGETLVDLRQWFHQKKPWTFRSDTPFVLVCPIYAWRLPLALEDFLRRAELAGSRELYVVATMGAGCGDAARYARQAAEGRGLRWMGFAGIVMPDNYLPMFKMPDPAQAAGIVRAAEPRIEAVGRAIAARRPLPPPAAAPGAGLLSGPVNAGFNRFARDPKGFAVSPACIHCGRCLAGCPTGNITEQAGRITFGPDCWFCLACLHNCPVHAIDWRGKGARNGFYTFPAELEG